MIYYFLAAAAVVFLVAVVMFVFSATALLLGMLLAWLFPVTAFQGALLCILLAIGVILAFLLGDVGKIGNAISIFVEHWQEEEEEEEKEGFLPRLTPFQRREKRVGRNSPCPCGSGRKYKNCCMRRGV